MIRQNATLQAKASRATGPQGVVRLLGPYGHLRSFSPFKLKSTAFTPSLAKTTGRISPSRRGKSGVGGNWGKSGVGNRGKSGVGKSGVGPSFLPAEIQCQSIILARKDEPTPDYSDTGLLRHRITPTPDYSDTGLLLTPDYSDTGLLRHRITPSTGLLRHRITPTPDYSDTGLLRHRITPLRKDEPTPDYSPPRNCRRGPGTRSTGWVSVRGAGRRSDSRPMSGGSATWLMSSA